MSYSISKFTRSKKRKLLNGLNDGKPFIKPTELFPYILNDSFIYTLKDKNVEKCNINEFDKFIMNKGIEFENEVVNYIKTKFPVSFVSDKITDETCSKTIEFIKKGVPIIHSAPFVDNKNKTRGIIDLLVRSDYLDKIILTPPISNEYVEINAPNIESKFHYVVIDIKFSTIPLRSDGIHILNTGKYKAYKSQCYIYNNAVGNIQGYTPRYSFILGRRWKYSKNGDKFRGESCVEKLGIIDYLDKDLNIIKITNDAIKWIRNYKKYGDILYENELYPNMCNNSGVYNRQKLRIAEKNGEITRIWRCSKNNRDIALNNNIHSWKDEKCKSNIIGIKGKNSKIIDNIMDINRQNIVNIKPQYIKTDIFDWKKTDNEIFVDFETISDIFLPFNLPEQKIMNIVFMIGVWYKSENNIWKYKSFISKSLNYDDEYENTNNFVLFVKKLNNPKIWYWHAEETFWNRLKNSQLQNLKDDKKIDNIKNNWNLNNWCDMCKIFKTEPITIKDCYKFGLKEVSSAMRKHSFINTSIDSNCDSGMTAMLNAYKCYKKDIDVSKNKDMLDIAKYNEFDVKVLYEILTYLRENHIKL